MSIKKIIQKENELNTNRPQKIKSLISIIAANRSIHVQRVPATNKNIIFCVADKFVTDLGQFTNQSDINERFKTKNRHFNASYYEVWDLEEKHIYCLNRIYFHLYLIDDRDDKEYILLHTDPKDPDLTHGNYKRSPHLHIKYSNDDIIPHAHLALNIDDYDTIMSTIDEISNSFKNHIKMLADQILKI